MRNHIYYNMKYIAKLHAVSGVDSLIQKYKLRVVDKLDALKMVVFEYDDTEDLFDIDMVRT